MDKKDIKLRKEWNDFIKQARKNSKITRCLWCGKEITRFCDSHTVPKTFLENIAPKTSLLMCAYQVYSPELEKKKLGLQEAGCFRMLCRNCDSMIFSDYEDDEKLLSFDNADFVLAQIAFKSTIRKLHDSLVAMSQCLITHDKMCKKIIAIMK